MALALSGPPPRQPDFDRIAHAYRWLEYLALGPLLARTRRGHLPRLGACRNALVLGDGDGRFTAELLAQCPTLAVTAVDTSAIMLRLLRARVREQTGASERLTTVQADARGFTPSVRPDLLVTHFFLDCLTGAEVGELLARILPHLAPDALWVVSEFSLPTGALGPLASIYIRALYFAFRIVTGLRVTRLPDWEQAFARVGFVRLERRRHALGLLTAELWQPAPQLQGAGPADDLN